MSELVQTESSAQTQPAAQIQSSLIEPWKPQHSVTNSECVVAVRLERPKGVTVTIAIVTVLDDYAADCKLDGRDGTYHGIVYYDEVAKGSYCMTHADLASFKQWALDNFPDRTLLSKEKPEIRTCPPPPLKQLEAAPSAA